MDVLFSPQLCPEGSSSSSSDTDPLLMARPTHHVIDITPNSQASTSAADSSVAHDFGGSRLVVSSSGPSNGSNSRMRVRHGEQRTIRSPLNSGLWVSLEAALTLSQIVASVVVLSLSRHEHTRAPLFAWIVGYASGCVATLPLLLWRYCYNNCVRELDSSQASPRIHDTSGTLLSTSRTDGGEEDWSAAAAASHRSNQASWLMNPRDEEVFG